MEYCSAMKKEEILPLVATWMGLEDIMLSEVSQRERQVLHDFTYVNLKKFLSKNQTFKEGSKGV